MSDVAGGALSHSSSHNSLSLHRGLDHPRTHRCSWRNCLRSPRPHRPRSPRWSTHQDVRSTPDQGVQGQHLHAASARYTSAHLQ